MYELEVYRAAEANSGAEVTTTRGFTTIRTFSTTDEYSPFVEATVQLSEIGDNLKENVGSSGYSNIYYVFPSGGGFRVTNTSLNIRYADSNTNQYNAETLTETISSSNGIGILATGSGFNGFWESWCFIKILDNNVGKIIPWIGSFYQYYLPLWYKEDFTWYGTRHYTVGTRPDGSTVNVPIYHVYNAPWSSNNFLIHTKGEVIRVLDLEEDGEIRLNNGTVFRRSPSGDYYQVGYYDGDSWRTYYYTSSVTTLVGLAYRDTDNPDYQDVRLATYISNDDLHTRVDVDDKYADAFTGLVVDIDPDVEEPSQYPTGKPGPEPGPTPPSPFPPGTGDYDTSSDSLPVPPVPNLGSPAGFVLWLPTKETLTEFTEYVWTSNFIDAFQRGSTSPLEVIIGLHMLPFEVAAAGTGTMKIGNIFAPTFTMNYTNSQIHDVILGDLKVTEFYGSLLDYAPYTEVQIYLPYVGLRSLDVDEVMGSTLSLRYRIDVSNGVGVAMLTVKNEDRNLDGVIYQWPCSMAYPVPLYWSAKDGALKTVQNALAAMAPVAGGAALGAGIAAASTAGRLAATAPRLATTLGNGGGGPAMITSGAPQLNAPQAAGALPPHYPESSGHFGRNVIAESALNGAVSGAAAVPNGAVMPKPDYSPPTGASKSLNHQAVTMSDTLGWLNHQQPYLIISRPVLDNPDQYTELLGKPAVYYGPLSQGLGYVKVGACLIPMQPYMSVSQYQEIVDYLGEGVIL